MKYTIIILIICLVGSLNAQNNFCGNTAIEQHIRQKDSFRYESFQTNFKANVNYFRKKAQTDFHLPNRIVPIYDYTPGASSMMVGGSTCPPTKYIIPVVVHVVHNNGTENISDAQINHQLEELNKHFSNYYLASAPAVNTGIQFILANKDIQNNTISGITRHQSYLYQHKKIKQTDSLMQLGINNLPMTHYIHIWIVKEILDANGNNLGVKAYATRPGSKFKGSEGVVISYDWMGDYSIFGSPVDANSRANALTHEVGHYLGLYHPFEGGCAGLDASDCAKKGDLCCDVPAVSGQNQNCSFSNSCTETYNNDAPDQKQNYMDYSLPECKNTFTADQTSIMHITLLTYRQALWQPTHINAMSSNNCVLSAQFTGNKNFMCTGASETALFKAYEQNNVSYQWTVWRNGALDNSLTSSTHTLNISNSTAGVYDIKLKVISGNSTEEFTMSKALEISACGNKIADHRANWYFGQYAGLGFYEGNRTFRELGPYFEFFDYGRPNINNEESSISFSNENGELMFYGSTDFATRTFRIYGSNYQEMIGSPVKGYGDALQQAVCFPAPGKTNEYIVVSSTGNSRSANGTDTTSGYVYHVVRINPANRSLDEVILKNKQMYDWQGIRLYYNEATTAIRHCNGSDYWLLCRGDKDTVYTIKVSNNYHFTCTGYFLSNEFHGQTQINPSPNGKFLSIGYSLFSFNRSNGKVQFIHRDNEAYTKGLAPWGSCFSNNNQFLYRSFIISENNVNNAYLYQYNLESGDANKSRQLVTKDYSLKNLQNGPDRKLYLSADNTPFISVINHPNKNLTNENNACDYQYEGPKLSENGIGGTCGLDLPNFPNTSLADKESLSFMAIQKNCNEVEFISNQTCGGYHIWEFGNGDTSHREQPSYTYTISGTYTVTLTVGDSVFSKEIHIGLPKSEYRIVGDSVSCDGDKVFIYSSKAGSDMVYNWSCVNCSASQANYNTFDAKFNSNGKIRLSINDNKTGCEFKDSLNFKFLNEINNNLVTVGNTCTNIEINGSTPSGGDSNFQYLWYVREKGGVWQTLFSETNKDLSNPISPSLREYMRAVKSKSCIVYSNIIQFADLDKLNVIFKSYSGLDTCSSIIRGYNLNFNFKKVTYQWQISLDNITWENISFATEKDLNYFINNEVKTYYRRKAISGSCEYFSNMIESTVVKLSKPLEQIMACSNNTFPIKLKYEFENESNLNLYKYFEKKSSNGEWERFDVIDNIGNTSYSLNKTNKIFNSQNLFDLAVGDSIRMLYNYYCTNYQSYYTNAIEIKFTEDIKILTQPNNRTVNGGDIGVFNIEVNDPENSTFKWQTSNSSSGPWTDIPNSNNDSLFISTGNCTASVIYYRAMVLHPCSSLTSNVVSLTINLTSSPSFDYWMKNSVVDVGIEPDIISSSFVVSQDIWIRHKNDKIKTHQDLNTQSDVNYVYVTIRNRGKNPTKSAKLYTYWTWGATQESWSVNWTNNINNQYSNSNFQLSLPMGGEINKTAIIIPEIPQYQTYTIAIPWTDFPKYGWYDLNKQWKNDRINICILARIETCDAAPYGMTNTELTDVYYNIKHNNNIVSRNTYTLPLYPILTDDKDNNEERKTINPNIIDGGTIAVRNNHDEAQKYSLCFKTHQSDYFTLAETYIEIGDALKSAIKWSPNVTLSGLTHVVDNVYQVTSSNACINSLVLPAHFQDAVLPLFAYKDINNRFADGLSFNTSIQQKDSLGNLMGECVFTLTDNLFVNPEPKYIESDTSFYFCNDGINNPETFIVSYSSNNAFPTQLYNENGTALTPNNSIYQLSEGYYTEVSIDSAHFTHYVKNINVIIKDEEIVNQTELIQIDCESLPFQLNTNDESVIVYENNTPMDSTSFNYYLLFPIYNFYKTEYRNAATCQLESKVLDFMDILQTPPTDPSAYVFAKYDRTEDSCAFVRLSDLSCNGTPLTFGKTIDIYDEYLQYKYTATIEQFGNSTIGFKFCPPIWNTHEDHIDDWHNLIYKANLCEYCRIDFKADSLIVFDKVSSINSIKNEWIKLYPNPTNKEVTIEWLTPITEPITIVMFDVMGKEVKRIIVDSPNKNPVKYSVEDLSAGVYHIYIPQLGYAKKLIVMKEE
jgi:hypothetical protein